MRWLITLVAALTSLAAAAGKAAEEGTESVEIPLKEIWAYDMPGTRDIRGLEDIPQGLPNSELFRRSHVYQIHLALGKGKPNKARSGFAVSGAENDALMEMRNVMTSLKDAPRILPANSDVTVAFFSYLWGSYVVLDEVLRDNSAITITYHFVSHASLDMALHFALIPIGKLTPGKYEVKFERLPATVQKGDEAFVSPPGDSDELNAVVCESFSFRVN